MADIVNAQPSPRLLSLPTKAVDVGNIERELARLWRDAAEHPEGGGFVTRACMSNLIIVCTGAHEANGIVQEIGGIVQLHPARVLLLTAGATDLVADLEAYVSAQCHLSANGQQICSEHVAVSAHQNATGRLPSVVRSLVVGDVPTSLWWATSEAPPRGGALFEELAEMADQVIYDSSACADAAGGLAATAQWAATRQVGLVIADLAWRRLEPWRRLISQSLDPLIAPGALDSIRRVVVDYAPRGVPQALYLVGWLSTCLGWQLASSPPEKESGWTFHSFSGPVHVVLHRGADGDAVLSSTAITWTTGGRSVTARFAFIAAGQLGARIDNSQLPPRVLVAPPTPRAHLIAQQLPDLERDSLFRSILPVARTMAEGFVDAAPEIK